MIHSLFLRFPLFLRLKIGIFPGKSKYRAKFVKIAFHLGKPPEKFKDGSPY